MIPPIQIRPDQAAQEVLEFNRKLGQGLQTLMDIDSVPTGVSPKEVVYREDKLVLYRFKSANGARRSTTPILIVYALVNRPYMMDLQEDRSLIKGLLAAGQDVYLIDWGYPDRGDRFLNLDDYINGYINRCVNMIRRQHKLDKINLLGVCQGGTFSLCYSALHPDKVKNLVTMVTPVDFKTPDNMLSRWIQDIDIDLLVDTLGNVSGEMLNWSFVSLKPWRLTGQKYLDLVNRLDDEKQTLNFLRMEKWIFDSPDQAGEAFRQFMKDFYQDNGLIKGTVRIGEGVVDLKKIDMPVLNIYAEADHLVPPSASVPLKAYVGTDDYEELAFPGGHIGLYVSGRSQKTVPPTVGEWLDARN